MKHTGCILDFTEQRNAELLAAYRLILSQVRHINIRDVSERVVAMPCSRFWVSEERAAIVCGAMLKGEGALSQMRPTKQAMFREIFRRMQVLRERNPEATVNELVRRVVNSTAPCFYMQPRCAMEIIYKIKKGEEEERRAPFYAKL